MHNETQNIRVFSLSDVFVCSLNPIIELSSGLCKARFILLKYQIKPHFIYKIKNKTSLQSLHLNRQICIKRSLWLTFLKVKWRDELARCKINHNFSHILEQYCRPRINDKKLVLLLLWNRMNLLWPTISIATIYYLTVFVWKKMWKIMKLPISVECYPAKSAY